jgi:hypothetical protein
MLRKLSSYLRRQWRQVWGTLAVLVMFFVPATRAVIASSHHPDSGPNVNHHEHAGDSRNCSRPTRSTPKPVSPVNPPSGSHSGASHE